ncbi:hypothetical protein GCM10010082_06670 [Kushneria pakistanensis]|uniref:Uncharacterized protein n=1 Tax=Kushneria pakistanensis TaxID=1508770 RepID=A0ABQ3FC61_9GAMM|nr:hypothetical protein [Kushneria pakistanensis]GHC18025.1 hypothetical protein GCM10010082_06670 [Kushneria pakistanensis]
MTIAVIWIVVFAIVAALAWKSWENGFGKMVKRWVPVILRLDDDRGDRITWCVVAGVLVATLMTNPASMLLTLLLIGLIVLIVLAVVRFVLSKVH